jgi:hypothetical protein
VASRKAWDAYRHARAGLGLASDILRFLGWKKTLLAFLTALITFFWAWLSRLRLVERCVLSLGVFASALVIANLFPKLIGKRLRFHHRRSGLQFVNWYSSSNLPSVYFGDSERDHGFPLWVEIGNTSLDIPISAKNVTARIEFVNDSQTTRLTVPEARWYIEKRLRDGSATTAWRERVDLDAGETAVFCLYVLGYDGLHYVYKESRTFVGILDDAHWLANVQVTSDSLEGFEGTLGFTISRYQGFGHDTPAFKMLRRIPPKLR